MSLQVDANRASYILHCLSVNFEGVPLNAKTALSELNLDSLELIESLFELENHYGKTLSNAELASLTTVGDLARAFDLSVNQK